MRFFDAVDRGDLESFRERDEIDNNFSSATIKEREYITVKSK